MGNSRTNVAEFSRGDKERKQCKSADHPESGTKIKPGTDLDDPCVVSVATLACAFLQRSGPPSLLTEARKARSLRAFGGSLHRHATVCAIG